MHETQTHVDLLFFLLLLLYLHEQRGLHWMKQTYPQMLVFILHCYHIKADNFRHSQQDRNNPNQNDFSGCPSWNPSAFDLIPGYDSPVSVKINGIMLRLPGLFVCNNDTFIHWFQNISRAYAKYVYLLDKIQIVYRACVLLQQTRQQRLFLHLSTLKAHKLSTVIPTDVFWRKGTSLHSPTPNGQSSAISCHRNKAQFSQWENSSMKLLLYLHVADEHTLYALIGMSTTMWIRSPTARLAMRTLGPLLMQLLAYMMRSKVELPTMPTTKTTRETRVLMYLKASLIPADSRHMGGWEVLGPALSGGSELLYFNISSIKRSEAFVCRTSSARCSLASPQMKIFPKQRTKAAVHIVDNPPQRNAFSDSAMKIRVIIISFQTHGKTFPWRK